MRHVRFGKHIATESVQDTFAIDARREDLKQLMVEFEAKRTKLTSLLVYEVSRGEGSPI